MTDNKITEMTDEEMFDLIFNDKENNYYNAFTTVKKQAESGNTWAQYYLGFLYQNGMGTIVNIKKAIKWYGLAADQEIPGACYNLGLLYRNGYGSQEAQKYALILIGVAAEKAHPQAQYYLATLYEDGIEFEKSHDKAFELYFAAANNGVPDAFFDVGRYYEQGLGKTTQSYRSALKSYKIAAEHAMDEKVLIESNFRLGVLYYEGKGAERSLTKAYNYFLYAAERGHNIASEYIRMMIINNELL